MGGGLQTWGEGHEITAPSNGVGHKNTRPFEGEVMKSTVKWQQSPPSYSIFANNFQGSTLVTPPNIIIWQIMLLLGVVIRSTI